MDRNRDQDHRNIYESVNALNTLQDRCGHVFEASVFVNETGSFEKKHYRNIGIYIGRGQYSDSNMPYIVIDGIGSYDAAYSSMKLYDDILVIRVNDKSGIYEIEVVPK